MVKFLSFLDYTSRKGADIADPWYTGNFDATYRDVNEGCDGLLAYILEQKIIEGADFAPSYLFHYYLMSNPNL